MSTKVEGTGLGLPIVSSIINCHGGEIRLANGPEGGALVRILLHLALVPVVVGVTYEFNRLVGAHDNVVTRILSAPGMWLQNFTTHEPDDSMIEVGIASLKAVIPEKKGQDAW